MKYFLFFFLTPLLLTYSQTDSLILDDFKSFVTIGADFYTSLLEFDSEDWIKFPATIGYFSGEFMNNHGSNYKEKTKINLFPIPGGLTFQLRF